MLSLLPYLWPAGNTVARLRVVAAVVCLVLAKVATVAVPLIYARIIDRLAPSHGEVLAHGDVLAHGGMLALPVALPAA